MVASLSLTLLLIFSYNSVELLGFVVPAKLSQIVVGGRKLLDFLHRYLNVMGIVHDSLVFTK
jgi:hypothetical protein